MSKPEWKMAKTAGMPKEAYRDSVKRLHKYVEPIAEKQGLSIAWDSDGVTVQPSSNLNYEALSIIVDPSWGYLIPDAHEKDNGGPNFCEPAPWKAILIDALMAAVEFDLRSIVNLRYARRVFAGEIVHPSVLAAIQ